MIELQIRRAGWKEKIQSLVLQLGLTCIADPDQDRTIITVRDKDITGWKCEIAIREGTNSLSIYINDMFFAKTLGNRQLDRLKHELGVMQFAAKRLAECARQDEADAKAWIQRQELELDKLQDMPWLEFEIIRSGPYAGRYQTRLLPGNPLEHLTVGEVYQFYAFCVKCGSK